MGNKYRDLLPIRRAVTYILQNAYQTPFSVDTFTWNEAQKFINLQPTYIL